MLLDGYSGLIVCDTRRAEEWRAGLRRAGFEVILVETRGRAAEKGAWEVAVATRQATEARALVTAVIQGDARLPSPPLLSAMGRRALVAVFVVVVVVAIVCLAGR